MKNLIIQYIFKRLSEASTIRGIILSLCSLIGYSLDVQQTDSLVWIVLGIVGIVGSFFPDRLGKQKTRSTDVQGTTVDYNTNESGWGDK